SKNTWVMTSNGAKQVKDLIGKSFEAIVNGKSYKSNGFWFSGNKETFKLKTKDGFEIELTGNHKVLLGDNSWKEAKDLIKGEKIQLSNNSLVNLSWDGEGSFDQGWILGSMLGDGHLVHANSETRNDQGCVRFWGDSQEYMANYAFELVAANVE